MVLSKETIRLKTDVLVVGGGGAALRAALSAKDCGVDVLIISKGDIGKSGATYYSAAEVGAFNVPDGAIDPTDTKDIYYEDIINMASGCADPKLARIIADEAEDAMHYLESCGMEFSKSESGKYNGYRACFSTKARSHISINHFKPLVKALREKLQSENITQINNLSVTNLIINNGQCFGAFAINNKNEMYLIEAKAVVLATGGASTLFKHNMYPSDITGDGYAVAYRAGAKLSNMEFLQAGIGLAYPVVNLFGNQLWEAMPKLTNIHGDEFVRKYSLYKVEEVTEAKSKHFPFSVRDISRYIEISIQKEVIQGFPTPRGNVYLDFLDTDFEKLLNDQTSNFRNMWPFTYKRFSELGIDLYKDKIEVACFAHAVNGGVLIDENAESSIIGLFAAGEVAAGPHGADRLGGNMSVTSQVFGKHAGAAAAKLSLEQIPSFNYFDDCTNKEKLFLESFSPLTIEKGKEILNNIQNLSDECLLIVRNEEKLAFYAEELLKIREGVRNKKESPGEKLPLYRIIELDNLITTGLLMAKAAQLRKESRGSHYREDYPFEDSKFNKMNILIK